MIVMPPTSIARGIIKWWPVSVACPDQSRERKGLGSPMEIHRTGNPWTKRSRSRGRLMLSQTMCTVRTSAGIPVTQWWKWKVRGITIFSKLPRWLTENGRRQTPEDRRPSWSRKLNECSKKNNHYIMDGTRLKVGFHYLFPLHISASQTDVYYQESSV